MTKVAHAFSLFDHNICKRLFLYDKLTVFPQFEQRELSDCDSEKDNVKVIFFEGYLQNMMVLS